MYFNFVLSICAQAGDQVDDMRDQLEAYGHEFRVSRGEFLRPPWINLFVESTDEASPNRIKLLSLEGYRFVALVTEEPTLVTKNGLVWNYQTGDVWLKRAERFVELAPYLRAAWCYAPGAAASLARFCRKAFDIDMAWGRRFLEPKLDPEPHYDFCFFGGLTERRERVISQFVQRGHRVDVIPHVSSLAERDARVPLSRVVLDIKQHEWWSLVSSVRYVTGLLCRRPTVAESRPSAAKARWARVVRFATADDRFYDEAIRLLSDYRAVY